MSRYVEYDCKQLRNIETLLAALATFGWSGGKVEVHEEAQALYGYHGDKRAEKANVIIRRNNTGIQSSNDIGFAKQADGTYKPIVSEYDGGALHFGLNRQPLQGGFVKGIERAYGKITGDKAISTILKTTIPKLKQRGVIPRHATAQTVRTGGTTKIVVTY